MGQSGYSADILGNRLIHISGGSEWDSTRFHYATQNDKQLKIYEVFIPAIFHFIFVEQLISGN